MQNLWTFVISSVILGICFMFYRKRTRPYQNIPSASAVFHFAFGFLFGSRDLPVTGYIFKKCVALSKKFETEGMFLVWPIFPVLVIFSEEAMKVFSKERAAIDKSFFYDSLKHTIGDGTIVCTGDTWKKRRKMFNPVFYTDMLKSSIATMNEYASILVKDLSAQTNKTINLLDHLKKFSCCVAGEFLLGINLHEDESKELNLMIQNIFTKLCEYSAHRMCNPLLHYQIFLPVSAYGRENLKFYKERKRLVSKLLAKMKESHSHRSSESEYENESGQSFPDVLLQHSLKDPSFTDKDIEDEICTYLSAGFETVAHTLLWCLFLLGHHQDIQNKVFTEVQSTTEEFITYDDICRLKYLECVIKETLRLYTTVPFYGRLLKEDVQCGKYKVPKGTSICFFPYMLHRNSEVFPHPENFNPDRFIDGSIEKRPWAYIPFSEGIRSCIGKKFAMMEMTVFLAYMIKNYKIQSLVERESVQFDYGVTLTPLKPLFTQLTSRKS